MTILQSDEDVRPAYLAADLLVCASDIESLPRSVLEAMALELPVLGTDVFGVPEVVRDGETGWLCVQRDTGALADTLARALATPPAERARLAAAARAVIEAEHELEHCAARYARCCAQSARRAPAMAGARWLTVASRSSAARSRRWPRARRPRPTARPRPTRDRPAASVPPAGGSAPPRPSR